MSRPKIKLQLKQVLNPITNRYVSVDNDSYKFLAKVTRMSEKEFGELQPSKYHIAQLKEFRDQYKVGKSRNFVTRGLKIRIPAQFALESNMYAGTWTLYNLKRFGAYAKDYNDLLSNLRPALIKTLQKERELKQNFRTILSARMRFVSRTLSAEAMPVFNSGSSLGNPVLEGSNIEAIADVMLNNILVKIVKYTEGRSGWIYISTLQVQLGTMKYVPQRGGSYIQLPKKIQATCTKAGVINIKSKDQKCFPRACYSFFHPSTKPNKNRQADYKEFESKFDCSMLSYPTLPSEIEPFEEANKLAITVIRVSVDDCKFVPFRSSKFSFESDYQKVTLLLIQDEDRYHYVSVKNVNALVRQSHGDHQGFTCLNCFRVKSSQEALDKHEVICRQMGSQIIKMPSEEDKYVQLPHPSKRKRQPIVMYMDMEAYLVPSDEKKGENTKVDNTHTLSGFGLTLACPGIPELEKYHQHRTVVNCEAELFELLHTAGEECSRALQKHRRNMVLTEEEQRQHWTATECYICHQKFDSSKFATSKVRDHCHATGKFLGSAHSKCNVLDKSCREIPVFIHNLKGYDSHFLLQHVEKYINDAKNYRLDVIAQTSEKFLTIGVKKSFYGIKFIFKDSFSFLSTSIDKLVESGKKSNMEFTYMKKNFPEHFELLTRKNVYPYEYMSSLEKFEETQLPPIDAFYSKLSGKGISEKDYEFAQQVWETMGCKTLQDYHDLYLKTDVLLLADVFENFRNLALKEYGLDPAHYVSIPGLAWDGMLITCWDRIQANGGLELFTNEDYYMFAERAIRGGISMVSNRYAKANNKYTEEGFDPNIVLSFILYLDANNLYGWSMAQKLPLNSFRMEGERDTDFFNHISDNADTGCFIEVDVEYPKELHDLHNDYPFLAEKVKVGRHTISPFTHALNDLNERKAGTCEKLVPHLGDRKNYVVHYRTLKQAVRHGLKVTKVHRVLWFKQVAWMKQYIDKNTELRKEAKANKDSFKSDFFKLMNNSVFGKTMENVRNRNDVYFTRINNEADNKRAQKYMNDIRLCEMPMPQGSSGLMTFNMKKVEVKLNKPIFVGASILDISKTLMYGFWYDYLLPKFGAENVKLLFTDTDSFCFHVKCEDFYKQTAGDASKYFDFSCYKGEFKNDCNKAVYGYMKDECPDYPIQEVVALKPKLYSIFTSSQDNDIHRAHKGCPTKAVTDKGLGLTHGDYLECLETGQSVNINFASIRSYNHELKTISMTKTGLSADDDKRYQLDKYGSFALGHYKLDNSIDDES